MAGKIQTTPLRRWIARLSRFCGLLLQIWRQVAYGNVVNARMSVQAVPKWAATCGSFPARGIKDTVELGVHRGGVGLVVNRVQRGLNPASRRLGPGFP